MLSLNTAYVAPENAADPKNRVGDFFMNAPKRGQQLLGHARRDTRRFIPKWLSERFVKSTPERTQAHKQRKLEKS